MAADIANGKRPDGMKDDEAALYDVAMQLYRTSKVSDAAYKAALTHFGERGVMDIIEIIGYYDLVSMTLIHNASRTTKCQRDAASTAPEISVGRPLPRTVSAWLRHKQHVPR